MTDWRTRSREHRARVRSWTEPYRLRRARHQAHPVYDFLFQYYPYSPGRLEEWHPTFGDGVRLDADERVALEVAGRVGRAGVPSGGVDGRSGEPLPVGGGGDNSGMLDPDLDPDELPSYVRFRPPMYRLVEGELRHDPSAISLKARKRLDWIRGLLVATSERRGNFGCYGIHEWAMVYRGQDIRHEVPLRLSQEEVDQVVESRPVVCSHFDAFRFFTEGARPLNRLQPTLHTREAHEQPGCIHANMDVYKWAYKSMPWVGSDLVLDAFELALELRTVDMRASPYDLAPFGFAPIAIETTEGRAEYQRRQKELSEEAQEVRGRLIGVLSRVLSNQPHMAAVS